MKKIFLIFIITFINLWAQDETPVDLKQLFLGVVGVGQNTVVNHTLQSMFPNAVWKLSGTSYVQGGINYSTLATYGNVDTANNYWPGFNFEWFPNIGNPEWALGFYKVSNSLRPNNYFYLDARDGNYGYSTNTDIFIFYSNSEDKYYYRTTINSEIQYNYIPKQSVLRVSDIRGNNYSTDLLAGFWEKCLVPTISSNGENPRLVWGKPNNFTVAGYKIYWRMNEAGPFYLLTTLSSNTYTYTHEDLLLGGNTIVEYYVVAYNGNVTTGNSDTVAYETSGFYKQLKLAKKDKLSDTFTMELFPNPSNEIVNIRIKLPEHTSVDVELYDTKGSIVKRIFTGNAEDGQLQLSESIRFLSQGVYFIRVNSSNQSLVKSFIRLK